MTDERRTHSPHGAPISRVREQVVYQNQFATVYDDPVLFPDGSEGHYLRVVESDGQPGVAMLAVCASRVALVRTYRYPLDAWEWAIPRGFAHGSDPSHSARKELAEELGRAPDALHLIGTVTPNSGLLTSRVQVYLARYPELVSSPADTNEVAEVRWVNLPAVRSEIVNGVITDAFTLSALNLAQYKGLI